MENSGYAHLEAESKNLDQMIALLKNSRESYDHTMQNLIKWKEENLLSENANEGIDKLTVYKGSQTDMENIKQEMTLVRETLFSQKELLNEKKKEIGCKIQEAELERKALESGKKAYPLYLTEAKKLMEAELLRQTKTQVTVEILADVLEVKDEFWRNAVEGYMGNHKLAFVVEPEYAKEALNAYKTLDRKRFYNVAVIDTEQIIKKAKPALDGSLADEVESELPYAKAYVDFLLGTLKKCDSMEGLRNESGGITKDLKLYQGYKLQYVNPKNYTEYAYIGQNSMKQRLLQCNATLKTLKEQLAPVEEEGRHICRLLTLEELKEPESLQNYREAIDELQEKENQKKELEEKIKDLRNGDLEALKAKKDKLEIQIREKNAQKSNAMADYREKSKAIGDFAKEIQSGNEELLVKEQYFVYQNDWEEAFAAFLEEVQNERADRIKLILWSKKKASEEQAEKEYDTLLHLREQYLRQYAFRGFALAAKHNDSYDKLLEQLQSDRLTEYMKKAEEQAKVAIYHFKTDFVYKIRDAIKEVRQQVEDLNKVLADLDFGKDKYRFTIAKASGEEGKYYEMFMDENLEINPMELAIMQKTR